MLNAKEILEQLRQARTMPCIVEQKKLETTEKIRQDCYFCIKPTGVLSSKVSVA